MFKKFLINQLIILTCLSGFAQPVIKKNISGYIYDSTTKTPISYVTIKTTQLDSLKASQISFSDSVGYFTLQGLNQGLYKIEFSTIGYFHKIDTISVSTDSRKMLLTPVFLYRVSTLLDEVVVQANDIILRREVDRLTYNVQNDPESHSQSIGEILKKVPLVSITAKDQLLIRGQSGVQIYVNNKPSSRFHSNPVEILNSIPANTIATIEIITTPPSSFDGQGVSGIINIVTLKSEGEIYKGNVGVRYNFPAGGPTLHGSMIISKQKFDFSLDFNFATKKTPTPNRSFLSYFSDSKTPTIEKIGNSNSIYHFTTAQLQASYQLDSLQLISGSIGIDNYRLRYDNFQISKQFNSTGDFIQQYSYLSLENNFFPSFLADINYEYKFKNTPERYFTISYRFNKVYSIENNNSELLNNFNYPHQINYNQRDHGGRIGNSIQFDLVLPGKNIKFETGIKTIFRKNFSDYEYKRDTLNGTQFYSENKFNYLQNIIGGYSSFKFNIKSVTIKGGIRAEYTNNISKSDIDLQIEGTQNYFYLLPSFSALIRLNNKNSISIGYSKRIWRPDIIQLNPFININDPISLTFGNPNLKPTLSNNIEIFYTYSPDNFSIDLGSNFFSSNNNIEIFKYFDSVSMVTKTTYENSSLKRNFGSTLSINVPITKSLSFNTNNYFTYSWLQNTTGNKLNKQNGALFNTYFSIIKRFKNNYTAIASGNYNNGILLLQGRSASYSSYHISLSKSFLDKKLNLSLSLNNFLKKYRIQESSYLINTSKQISKSQRYYRQIKMSINFRFGKLKSRFRETNKKIILDDIKE